MTNSFSPSAPEAVWRRHQPLLRDLGEPPADGLPAVQRTPWRTEFTYDGLGRLRIRKEYEQAGWTLVAEVHYLYDGWRVIQERDGNNTPTVSYTRGTDLSGSLEGAGGIGGLLARSHGYSGGNWSTHNCYHADGNGNITYLVDSSQGLAASYRYDPFGNTSSSSGSLADANVYRFSSKELHAKSAAYYYGYRFYDANLQRWLNRDPIGEAGGMNLYSPDGNDFIDRVDIFGLATVAGLPGGPLDVRLTPCEIVKVIDHGTEKPRYRFMFPKKTSLPSAAGFIGCYAKQTNQPIPAEHRIGGVPPKDDIWAGTISPYYDNPFWQEGVKALKKGADDLAKAWLKSGKCKFVRITEVGDDGKVLSTRVLTPKDVESPNTR